MQNMKEKLQHYVYRTGEAGDIIEIEVGYDKGGFNAFSGSRDPRGVYVAIHPMKIENGLVSFTLFTGVKAMARPCGRKSPKQIKEVAELIDPVAPKAAELFEADRKAAIAMLREAATQQGVNVS